MFNYLITISYDGSAFFGWAKQPNKFTVQGYIEGILSKVFREKIIVNSLSRLDKGVHAMNQNFSVCLKINIETSKFFYLLTKVLKLVLVKKAELLNRELYVSENVILKEYRYFINTGELDLWKMKYRWEYCQPLLVKKLQNIFNIFVGEHDFFNFCFCRTKDREEKNTIRKIDSITVLEQESLIIIVFKGKGFLRYQIRAIVGEVISCYEGRYKLENLIKKLFCLEKGNSVDNDKYRCLAPPSGLYLWMVKFKNKVTFP